MNSKTCARKRTTLSSNDFVYRDIFLQFDAVEIDTHLVHKLWCTSKLLEYLFYEIWILIRRKKMQSAILWFLKLLLKNPTSSEALWNRCRSFETKYNKMENMLIADSSLYSDVTFLAGNKFKCSAHLTAWCRNNRCAYVLIVSNDMHKVRTGSVIHFDKSMNNFHLN